MKNDHIDPSLAEHYRNTNFKVLEPKMFILKIGEFSKELMLIYAKLNVSSAGYLTAWNPRSEIKSQSFNNKAQKSLKVRLLNKGYPAFKAFGADPNYEWPGEESLFVPGLSLDDSIQIGLDFRQNAIVWVGKDAIPELVFL